MTMKKYNLNKIKKGSVLCFAGTTDGVVKGVWEGVGVAGSDDISSMRLYVSHLWGESYHHYRHDGRSMACASQDIISIDGIKVEY